MSDTDEAVTPATLGGPDCTDPSRQKRNISWCGRVSNSCSKVASSGIMLCVLLMQCLTTRYSPAFGKCQGRHLSLSSDISKLQCLASTLVLTPCTACMTGCAGSPLMRFGPFLPYWIYPSFGQGCRKPIVMSTVSFQGNRGLINGTSADVDKAGQRDFPQLQSLRLYQIEELQHVLQLCKLLYDYAAHYCRSSFPCQFDERLSAALPS